MNADVQLNLALILFLPWYLILASLYWLYPRQPRDAWRRGYDAIALALTTALSIASMQWAYRHADVSVGPMWKQILATSVCYGVFLGGLTLAFLVRRRAIARRIARRPASPLSQVTP